MIQSFRHRGLECFFKHGDRRRIPPQFESKLRRLLTRLHSAVEARDMDAPGLFLHRLRGDLSGFWSVRVNWRLIFRFEDGKAFDVDLVDYH